MDNSANNKRIAKNTLMLYIRMLFTMAVTLYTSRVVLNTLGVVDYGLYNVVGGIVTMFVFLNSAMVAATQRYLTFELGRGDFDRLRIVFTTSVQIHGIISLIITLLGETVGLWLFYHKMVIPPDRVTAALWVFHLSIVSMVISIMSVPYNAAIVAHEKMDAFAMISVLEVILKLLIVYLLTLGSMDKLVLYAILIACVNLLIRCVYSSYSHKHFPETRLLRILDMSLVKEMGSFAGWNVWGHLAGTLSGAGVNLLLNMFFGPSVNAARAVAVQVETAINHFSTNFLMAVNPQITKRYAQGSISDMHKLIYRSSKFAFFLLFTFSLPIMMEAEMILKVWLKNPPEYSVIFLRLLLCVVMIDTIARPLMTAAAATGDVRKYHTLVGGVKLLVLPIAYLVLKLGGEPMSVYVVHITVCLLAFITRLIIVRPMIGLSIRDFASEALLRILVVVLIALIIPLVLNKMLTECFLSSVLMIVICILCAGTVSYAIGLTKGERAFINDRITFLLRKKMSHR